MTTTAKKPAKRAHWPSYPRERLYNIWRKMVQRCSEKGTEEERRYYYDRGIRVCDAWVDSFEQFARDVGQRPSASHSLDRIDNSRGYEPGNVRWATQAEQNINTRSNVFVSYQGEFITVSQLVARSPGHVCDRTVRNRLERGWSPERAILAPVAGKKLTDQQVIDLRVAAARGESVRVLAERYGIALSTAHHVASGHHRKKVPGERRCCKRP